MQVGGLGLPNVCFVVRREIMHHHHTRARAPPPPSVRPNRAGLGYGYGSKMTILFTRPLFNGFGLRLKLGWAWNLKRSGRVNRRRVFCLSRCDCSWTDANSKRVRPVGSKQVRASRLKRTPTQAGATRLNRRGRNSASRYETVPLDGRVRPVNEQQRPKGNGCDPSSGRDCLKGCGRNYK